MLTQPDSASHAAKFFLPVRNKKKTHLLAHLSANVKWCRLFCLCREILIFYLHSFPLVFCPSATFAHLWLTLTTKFKPLLRTKCVVFSPHDDRSSCMQMPTFWKLHWPHLEYVRLKTKAGFPDASKAFLWHHWFLFIYLLFYLKSKKNVCSQMEVYTVTVATGTAAYSGTNNYVYLTLLGEHGESERTLLDNPGLDFCRGAVRSIERSTSCRLFPDWRGLPPSLRPRQVDEYKVASPSPLGSVLVVRLEKQKYWVEDNWFCRYVKVEPPAGASELIFPCYQWLIGEAKVEIREGTGKEGFWSQVMEGGCWGFCSTHCWQEMGLPLPNLNSCAFAYTQHE